MTTLVAIGYPDETTAAVAAEDVCRLGHVLLVEPEAVAVVVRDASGRLILTADRHATGGAPPGGGWWARLLGPLLAASDRAAARSADGPAEDPAPPPPPASAAAPGPGPGGGPSTVPGLDARFRSRFVELLRPGTSALFLLIEAGRPERTLLALSRFGGTVLISASAGRRTRRSCPITLRR
ncbi:MAG TPA: hypothetical protein VNV66_06970 [Pilimelia sp.]|nr:hypothetical protein [Pilimelia sp.]